MIEHIILGISLVCNFAFAVIVWCLLGPDPMPHEDREHRCRGPRYRLGDFEPYIHAGETEKSGAPECK